MNALQTLTARLSVCVSVRVSVGCVALVHRLPPPCEQANRQMLSGLPAVRGTHTDAQQAKPQVNQGLHLHPRQGLRMHQGLHLHP